MLQQRKSRLVRGVDQKLMDTQGSDVADAGLPSPVRSTATDDPQASSSLASASKPEWPAAADWISRNAIVGGLSLVEFQHRYALRKKLRSGSFGHVYEARSAACPLVQDAGCAREGGLRLLRTPESVAIKVVVGDAQQEACIQSTMRNQHILELLAAWTSPFYSVLVLPLASQTLHAHVQSYPDGLRERQVNCLAMQMCAGVVYLHGLRILHRDLHSGNVLLTEKHAAEGSCKWHAQVSDFGKACPAPGDRQLVLPIAYRSPELLFAQGASLEQSKNAWFGGFVYKAPPEANSNVCVDIWALACLFLYASTRDLPFGYSEDGAKIAAKMLQCIGVPDRRMMIQAKWAIFQSRAGPQFLQTFGKRRAPNWPSFLSQCLHSVFQWDMELRPSARELQRFFGDYCSYCLPDLD